jgi:hypothetical protein
MTCSAGGGSSEHDESGRGGGLGAIFGIFFVVFTGISMPQGSASTQPFCIDTVRINRLSNLLPARRDCLMEKAARLAGERSLGVTAVMSPERPSTGLDQGPIAVFFALRYKSS